MPRLSLKYRTYGHALKASLKYVFAQQLDDRFNKKMVRREERLGKAECT